MVASSGTSRRTFFARATEVLGALLAGGLGIPALIYMIRAPKTVMPGGFVDAVDLTQLKPRVPEEIAFQRIRKNGWKLITEKSTAWVVKLSDSEVVAYSPGCTHLGCAYHWEANKNEFVCPCHTTSFSIEGKVLGGPAPRPLDQYAVKKQGDRLLIGNILPANAQGGKKSA